MVNSCLLWFSSYYLEKIYSFLVASQDLIRPNSGGISNVSSKVSQHTVGRWGIACDLSETIFVYILFNIL